MGETTVMVNTMTCTKHILVLATLAVVVALADHSVFELPESNNSFEEAQPEEVPELSLIDLEQGFGDTRDSIKQFLKKELTMENVKPTNAMIMAVAQSEEADKVKKKAAKSSHKTKASSGSKMSSSDKTIPVKTTPVKETSSLILSKGSYSSSATKAQAKTPPAKATTSTPKKKALPPNPAYETAEQVSKNKDAFSASEKKFKTIRKSLKDAKEETQEKIRAYMRSVISLSMTKINKEFKAYAKKAAGEVRAATDFKKMKDTVKAMETHMRKTAKSMMIPLKEAAAVAKKNTESAFSAKVVMTTMLQEGAAPDDALKTKLKAYFSKEQEAKSKEKARLKAVRQAASKRLQVAGAIMAVKIAQMSNSYSASVEWFIKQVRKAKTLKAMKKISMLMPKKMAKLASIFHKKLRNAVASIMKAAKKRIDMRKQHAESERDKSPLPDKDIAAWSKGKLPRKLKIASKKTGLAKVKKTLKKATTAQKILNKALKAKKD